MIKVQEVLEENTKYKSDTPAYTEPQVRARKVFVTRDCLLNPDYIVAAYQHTFDSSVDKEMLSDNFSGDESFTRIILDGNSFRSSEIIINMAFEEFRERLS